jgi:threonine/homoserine/homoserine lactone efflux protein
MNVVFTGIVTGLILSFMLGPVFFVLLETSIKKGVKAAIAFDLGVLLNDIFYIFIAVFFLDQVSELAEGSDNSLLMIIGGSLFSVYGVINFFKKVSETKVEEDQMQKAPASHYLFLFIKGFLLNLANPLIVFYWFSIMTIGYPDSDSGATDAANIEGAGYKMILFIASILITFFSIDLLKIFGAKKLRPLVTRKRLILLNRLIGIVFVVFGVYLIAKGTHAMYMSNIH